MLARALNLRSTVALVGAGCSAALGYPLWNAMVQRLIKDALDSLETREDEASKLLGERLGAIQSRVGSGGTPDGSVLAYAMSLCKEALKNGQVQPGGLSPYHAYFQDWYAHPHNGPDTPHQPLHHLLKLDTITRFVTTNYDCEIERALTAKQKVEFEQFGINVDGEPGFHPKGRRSFTQEAQFQDQLALFALARQEQAKHTVFHCHGRFDRPESIVATEGEYQDWYLADRDGQGPAFRQTIDLLFGSNPILFVGFGLRDEDLLRFLRLTGAAEPERKDSRPLFALLPEAREGADWDQHEFYYERYGLHVIPFTSPSPANWSEDLCLALDDIRRHWKTWREGWLRKPFLRKVTVNPTHPAPYRHYSLDMSRLSEMGGGHVRKNLRKIEDELNRNRVVTLVGLGGAGKSWHAMRLLEHLEKKRSSYEGTFFWSSYYADDLLTGLDRVLSYMDPEGKREGSRVKRFTECLIHGKFLLVFDGFERLLRETTVPGQGTPDSRGVDQWLTAMNHKDSKSKVILTSRLWPYRNETEGVSRFRIPRMRIGDITEAEPFNAVDRLLVSAICSLLGGHAYGLSLARRYLHRQEKRRLDEQAGFLVRSLADTRPNARVSRMIGLVVREMREATDGMAEELLQRLAVFMSPVGESTLQVCFELALEALDSGRGRGCSRDSLVERLVESRLLFRIRTTESGPERVFSIHPAVRSYVFTQIHRVDTDLLPNFTLPGFTSGTAAVYPGTEESAALVKDIFDRLYQEGELAVERGMHERRVNSAAARWGSLARGWKRIPRLGGQATRSTRESASGWSIWPNASFPSHGPTWNVTTRPRSSQKTLPCTRTNSHGCTTMWDSPCAPRVPCRTATRCGSRVPRSTGSLTARNWEASTMSNPNSTLPTRSLNWAIWTQPSSTLPRRPI